MKGPQHDRPCEGVGNIIGIDPHKRTLSATVLDGRGGVLGTEHFQVSGQGHRALQEWALSYGSVNRWGVEGASGIGRHTTMFLCRHGHDVRDVCPTRTNERGRRRHQGKSDSLDSERIARETLAHPDLALAFKRAGDESGPDEHTELLSLWHNERRSVVKQRQQLLNETETLLSELPEELRDNLPTTKAVRPRLVALGRRDRSLTWGSATALRLQRLDDRAQMIGELDARERAATRELGMLVEATSSTLDELTGIATRAAAELLVETGDPRRFTEGGFARFNGSAPLPASTAEGPDEPVRHRLNRGGNRRVNSVLHRMSVTQLRCEPRARKIYADARGRGHTKREAMRILKRHLSNIVYRRMMRDLEASGKVPIRCCLT
jgi:transposase